MSKIIKYLPGLDGDEQVFVARLVTEMTEEQADQFVRVYRERRKDPSTVLLLTLGAFIGIAGLNRFFLGQIGTKPDIETRMTSHPGLRSCAYMLVFLFGAAVLSACNGGANEVGADAMPPAALSDIELPPGFEINLFAEDVTNARSMALSPGGVLFVGTRSEGSVYALVDRDGDHVADEQFVLATGLNMPNGVAFRDGALYVAEVNRILRFDDIEGNLDSPLPPVVVRDDFPTDAHHGWKYIAFGPDDKLYVPVGAPCNICNPSDPYASIMRMNADGTGLETFAHGVRNTVGFTWHPQTDELWFTDNGRDHLGDDSPPCELNRAPEPGLHFGYPFLHGKDVVDPEYGDVEPPAGVEVVTPVQELSPHVAPLGMEFYTGGSFPAEYHNQVFIAEHGSWNRSEKIGYRVTLVRLDASGRAVSYEPFASGWLQGQENWGRPVDLELMPDGSMLVSDDQGGRIFRIAWVGQ